MTFNSNYPVPIPQYTVSMTPDCDLDKTLVELEMRGDNGDLADKTEMK